MPKFLFVDFGSTFTKLTAVDSDALKILGTAKAITTVDSDIAIGYEKALDALHQSIGDITFDKITACSSAAGGLKLAAIGLVEELTVEAAKRVCLGAGGKVEAVFSHYLNRSEVKELKERDIDIVLLAGGTDGGNQDCVIHNAKKLAEADLKVPIIFAGNKSARDDVETIFLDAGIEHFICDNVMPKLNVLNIDSARQKIKDIFVKNIIEAKGIKQIEKKIDEVILPTPNAVLMAAELLSKGYKEESGLNDIVLVDIGGATTDLYSMTLGLSHKGDVVYKGLEEPYAKRTVEGDLGMRYSAHGIVAALNREQLEMVKDRGIDLEAESQKRRANIDMIPETEEDFAVETEFAKLCSDIAMTRHVGHLDKAHTPFGMMYYQTGKDLTNVKAVIGTGGVIINALHPKTILEGLLSRKDKATELRPKETQMLLDKEYILSAMGLLSLENPMAALKIMKQKMMKIG